MTDASKTTYATKNPFSVSNDDVYEALHRMGGCGTAEDVIVYFYGSDLVSVTEGKRRAQPIYRALSELAKAGRLDDSDQVLNAETNARTRHIGFPIATSKQRSGTATRPGTKPPWKRIKNSGNASNSWLPRTRIWWTSWQASC